MKKLLPLMLLFCFCLLSCKEDMTSGQMMVAELQSVIKDKRVTEIQILNDKGNPSLGINYDYSFSGETLRVGTAYYNINRLISYSVDTYYREYNGRELKITYLAIVMDLP